MIITVTAPFARERLGGKPARMAAGAQGRRGRRRRNGARRRAAGGSSSGDPKHSGAAGRVDDALTQVFTLVSFTLLYFLSETLLYCTVLYPGTRVVT